MKKNKKTIKHNKGDMVSLFGPNREERIRREQLEIRNYLDNEIRNAYAAFESRDYQAALFYFNKVLSYGNVPAIQNDRQ